MYPNVTRRQRSERGRFVGSVPALRRGGPRATNTITEWEYNVPKGRLRYCGRRVLLIWQAQADGQDIMEGDRCGFVIDSW